MNWLPISVVKMTNLSIKKHLVTFGSLIKFAYFGQWKLKGEILLVVVVDVERYQKYWDLIAII